MKAITTTSLLLAALLTTTLAWANSLVTPNVDIAALAKQYQGVSQAETTSGTPSLWVFVSFSMPKASLQALEQQVNLVGGQLVIRGLIDNSLKKTADAVSQILVNGRGGLSIDPPAFQQYHITKVPAFVVTKGQDESDFDVVYGNVTLEAALTELANKGNAASDVAQSYLTTLHARTQV